MFLLDGRGGVFDYDLESLAELLHVIDHQMDRVDADISISQDPDSLGCFDRMEGVIGLGFVACQQYINATYPQVLKDRLQALKSPPFHANKKSIAELINAAANYWKHHDEWVTDDAKAGSTKATIEFLVPSPVDYTMATVLHELLKPQASRFASVVPLITQWRDLLIAGRRPT